MSLTLALGGSPCASNRGEANCLTKTTAKKPVISRPMQRESHISIRRAAENNLKNISLEIPHGKLIAVTGVSGSGKSSLAFDVIAREGQRRFFETYSAFSRQFLQKWSAPQVDAIDGLLPVITLSQKTLTGNARSTVGTLSDLYDYLRLLFARLGHSPENIPLSRSLFSFNSPKGACPRCQGLGLEEQISLDILIADPAKTLREGALAPTLPTGYIMYSQVTIDALNEVCEAHGFSVDIPWQDLTPEQQKIVLYGSERIKVPIGKHSLESRLKWTGIAAKPREKDFYKGIINIMEGILRRDRNKNILRYAESVKCSECEGIRLNEAARKVEWRGKTIGELVNWEVVKLGNWLEEESGDDRLAVAKPVIQKMTERIKMMQQLGIGYLPLHRPSGSLTGGESQRIRLINQVAAELSRVLYVFDEPSIGLHPRDNREMLRILRRLVDQGNTVIVVEHDPETIRHADWIVELGPGAGREGGELLFNGPASEFLNAPIGGLPTPTQQIFLTNTALEAVMRPKEKHPLFSFIGCSENNLKNVTATFRPGGLNAVSGVAGAGKSALVHGVIQKAVEAHLAGHSTPHAHAVSRFKKLVTLDQKPIGRTPRSNPATYTGLADRIRDLFAKEEAAKQAGFGKSRFSFNTKGGRCETCQGAGRIQIGMHLLGQVDVVCETCQGKRFNDETLAIRYRGKNIHEVFELRVEEAFPFFEGEKKVLPFLQTLKDIGLGYLQLGQPSTTLSGGEAQRIRLAVELNQSQSGDTLYLLDEPTIGLHQQDVEVLLKAFRNLTERGNTLICIENDTFFLHNCDWLVDMGPESGENGGEVLFCGFPHQLASESRSLTGKYLRTDYSPESISATAPKIPKNIHFKGVSTHLLQNIDITFPHAQMTVLTGVSGSGKTSLAFHTLYAEGQNRFSESLSTYARSLLRLSNTAQFESVSGLGPVVAIGRKYTSAASRSTVGTLTGLNAQYRLLFSRIGQLQGKAFSARDFSANHESGACPACTGLGFQLACDAELLIENPEKVLGNGVLRNNRVGKFYEEAVGKHFAILKTVAKARAIPLEQPWNTLEEADREVILYGTGDKIWSVTWEFQNKTRSGTQEFEAKWEGFCHFIEDEYQRKLQNKDISALEELMHEVPCETCKGQKLKPELLAVEWEGMNFAEWEAWTLETSLAMFSGLGKAESAAENALRTSVIPKITGLLQVLNALGLGYLSPARNSRTLSGGEAQRVRLAGAFATDLHGVTYVLDEPTIGLDADNVRSLLAVLDQLKAKGNTLVVVEHDETVIRAADHLIELGPGAGRAGGTVVASGALQDLQNHPTSLTGKYLRQMPAIRPAKTTLHENAFGLSKATKYGLPAVDADFPAGGLIVLTGPSGSGKSTLMEDILYASARAGRPVHCASTYGLERFEKVLLVDQQPFTRQALSSVATRTSLMDLLRDAFAALPNAKVAKLKKSAFSYNHKSGACPDCRGTGIRKTALDFLGDVETPCDSCGGLRYRPEVLAVKHDGKSIGEVLQMTVAEGAEWFSEGKIVAMLQELQKMGLGHLRIGQSTSTLSGGEAQRLKLALSLSENHSGQVLFLLDEPTTGLHFQDVEQLLGVFEGLLRKGHTVMVVEHHPMVVGAAHEVFLFSEKWVVSGEK